MTQQPLENVRIGAFDLMPSPEEIHARVPLSDKASDTVLAGREAVKAILDRKDPRILPDMAVKVTFIEDAKSEAAAPTSGG